MLSVFLFAATLPSDEVAGRTCSRRCAVLHRAPHPAAAQMRDGLKPCCLLWACASVFAVVSPNVQIFDMHTAPASPEHGFIAPGKWTIIIRQGCLGILGGLQVVVHLERHSVSPEPEAVSVLCLAGIRFRTLKWHDNS